MKFKIKRILAVMLVFCMMMGMLPNMIMTAHAAGDTLTWDEDSSGEIIVKWDPSYFDNDGSLWVNVKKDGAQVEAFHKATILGSVSVGQIIRDNGSGKYVVSVSRGTKELTTSEKTINFSEQLAKPVVSYDAATMTLSWEPVTNAAHYHLKVYCDYAKKDDRTLTDTTVDLSYVMGGAGTYQIYLQAISTDQNRASSKEYHMEITKEATIPAVTGLKINDYILSWDACTDANRYWFHVKKNGVQIGATGWVEDTSKDLLEIFAEYGAGEYTFDVSAYYGGTQVREEASINFTNSDPYAVRVIAVPAEGGTVTGSGAYKEGDEITVTATPNAGYKFLYWTMDTVYVNSNPTYTFDASSGILRAYFEKTTTSTHTIKATAGTGGTISPSGEVTVNKGDGVSFEIKPNDGYEIKNVIVDGAGVGPKTTYSFSDVKANHTIEAVFEEVTPPAAAFTVQPDNVTVKVNEKAPVSFTFSDGAKFGCVEYEESEGVWKHLYTFDHEAIVANNPVTIEIPAKDTAQTLNCRIKLQAASDSELYISDEFTVEWKAGPYIDHPDDVTVKVNEKAPVSFTFSDGAKFGCVEYEESEGVWKHLYTFDHEAIVANNAATIEIPAKDTAQTLNCRIKLQAASDSELYISDEFTVEWENKEVELIEITEIVINGVNAPVVGGDPTAAPSFTLPDGANYVVESAQWMHGINDQAVSSFIEGNDYRAVFKVVPKDGYKFASEPTMTINDENASVRYNLDTDASIFIKLTAVADGGDVTPSCDHAQDKLALTYEDETGHWYECECGEYRSDMEDHEFEDDSDASCDCGYEREINSGDNEDPTNPSDPTDPEDPNKPSDDKDDVIKPSDKEDKPEADKAPQTGDDSNMFMWFAAMILAGITGLGIFRKRRTE